MIHKLARYKFLAAVVLVGTLMITLHQYVSATSGTGYFTGQPACTTNWSGTACEPLPNTASILQNDVIRGRTSEIFPYGPDAIPAYLYDGVNDKADFINFILGRLGSANVHDHVGAAFVINTMIQASPRDINPTAAMIADWQARINQPTISFGLVFGDPNTYGNGQISFYDPMIQDAFYSAWPATPRNLLVFTGPTGVEYVLEVPCGNPVGGLGLHLSPVPPPLSNSCSSLSYNPANPEPGVPVSLSASMTLNRAPIGGFTTSMTATSPLSGISMTQPSSTQFNYTANTIPPGAGTFTVTWSVTAEGSTLSCSGTYVASYHPFFTVNGGDASAGLTTCTGNTWPIPGSPQSAIIKSHNFDGGNYFGAGTQDAAFALGQISSFITNLNTGAGPGSPSAHSLATPYSLSFANNSNAPVSEGGGNNGGGFGAFGYCAKDYAAVAASRSGVINAGGGGGGFNIGAAASGTYTINGNLNLAGAVVPAGRHITLIVTGNVYITGNITAATAGSVQDLPYFELLLQTNGGASESGIFVSPSVDTLYGLYSSHNLALGSANGGMFVTCASSIGNEMTDYSQCAGRKLTIQGALSADNIRFDRSYGTLHGSGPGGASPSETVQFTPTLWLGAAQACRTEPTLCSITGSVDYDSVTSLPPIL